ALLRRRIRIERIDLDHEAEAIGLVLLLCEIEAIVKLAPGIEIAGHAIAGLVARFRMIGIAASQEIAVDVLLAGEPGAPGRDAAPAIIEHAEPMPPARVGPGLQARMSGRRPSDLHRCIGIDAAGIFRARYDAPPAVLAPHLDHAAADRRHLDRDCL